MLPAHQLLDTYYQQRQELLNYLARILNDREQAQDLLQDMWLRLTGHVALKVDKPSAYLFRMARNLAIDSLRQEKLQQTKLDQFCDEKLAYALRQLDSLQMIELSVVLQKLLRHQPEAIQKTFYLYCIAGHSMQDIANQLDISLGQVHRLLRLFNDYCQRQLN